MLASKHVFVIPERERLCKCYHSSMNPLTAFIDFIVNLFKKPQSQFFTGVLPDNRSASEKAKDYLSEEMMPPSVPDPFSNAQLTISPFPYLNQLGTSSCVAHAVTLALAIERKADVNNFSILSAMFPYRLRSNYAQAGSAPQNIFQILKKTGSPLSDSLPTPQFEFQANNLALTDQMYTEASIYKGLDYYTLGVPNSILTIARIAMQGHGVPITLFATEEEYSIQYPTIINPKLTYYQAEIQHEVCVLPYSGFIKDGVKYVAIQDSAWFGGWKLRYLSEAFIKARVYGAGYWDTVQILATGKYPKHVFTYPLRLGDNNDEVKLLQQMLIAEGLLPATLATGLFGGKTLAAVRAFQSKYASDILIPAGLTAPTGFFGELSIKKANVLCQ